ncbi:hypothetical protein DUNSADRAFT_5749 [Dunaliella salina]|uniref:AMP-activated protein kinase glycogen-binding domain-containing protein n=1 Tax=Dunaliella salina TaxID=3046 RepID=A0ABQ7H754_DUNSA|nr:hypothetical protein DUNSADRAFT_5749 [Dunaliella salina]|eukprot:KAF5842673.1 hypothetical protein DUNSADRAFT_5749 [Dunaliella salina]
MWPAQDIRRVHWAISNRSSKVKLVFERRGRKSPPPAWYSRGQVGCASSSKDVMELPVSFLPGNGLSNGSWGQDLLPAGRPMFAGFHRCSLGSNQTPPNTNASSTPRAKRLERLRTELTQAGKEGPIYLTGARSGQNPPSSAPGVSPDGHSSSSGLSSGSSASGDAAPTHGQPPSQGPNNKKKKTKKVMPVLPWLLVTSSHLSLRDLTHLASHRCLSALLELGLTSFAGVQGNLLRNGPDNCAALCCAVPCHALLRCLSCRRARGNLHQAGPNSCAVTRCCCLCCRRAYGNLHRAGPNSCAVLLHCGSNMRAQVATLFAGWMHWFCHMQMQEAILSAEIALNCSIDQSVLEQATEELLVGAAERASRPGTYYYKFIVDGVWAIDPLAPKVLDASGNWNNVLQVMPAHTIRTSKERLSVARWHALLTAFEAKMGLGV